MTNSTITPEVIKHIADLAMITLTDEEVAKYQRQLAAILEYVKKVNEINTDEMTYVSHVDLVNIMRADKVEPSLTQAAAIQNRQISAVQGYFTINTVLPTEES